MLGNWISADVQPACCFELYCNSIDHTLAITCNQNLDLSVWCCKDFWARVLVVNTGIVRVVKLPWHESIWVTSNVALCRVYSALLHVRRIESCMRTWTWPHCLFRDVVWCNTWTHFKGGHWKHNQRHWLQLTTVNYPHWNLGVHYVYEATEDTTHKFDILAELYNGWLVVDLPHVPWWSMMHRLKLVDNANSLDDASCLQIHPACSL